MAISLDEKEQLENAIVTLAEQLNISTIDVTDVIEEGLISRYKGILHPEQITVIDYLKEYFK